MPLNKNEIRRLLEKEDIAFIATMTAEGNPHIAPMWFVVHKGRIYFETDKTTVKFKNIKSKNKIALSFGTRESYTIEGKVKWWEEKDAPLPFRKLLRKKYGRDMDDSFITKSTFIFEVIPEKEMSWHYAPDWD